MYYRCEGFFKTKGGTYMDYRQSIEFIAFKDQSNDLSFDSISEYLTVELTAQLFFKPIETVVEDVLKLRCSIR